jgi:FKBP-type peptidyl-prolyl cis-trans isomerase
MTRQLFAVLIVGSIAAAAPLVGSVALAQERPKIGETITTESGLVYRFTQLGNGPQPQTGDLMVIHGIGTLAPLDGARGAMSDSRMADGKEFWNTRSDGSPYEYTFGVDSVIRGFS